MISQDDVRAAREALSRVAFVRRTPLMRLAGARLGVDCAEVWLKLEHLQVSGSFKARGMMNRLLAGPIPEAGVIVASGGNAGIATAEAAKALGVPCEVYLPEASTPAKRARLAALGAKVVVQGAVYADALAACLARQAETGALLTHAYDQPEVAAGAGTLALEIEEDAGLPDSVLVSVGGGGLVAGIAAWFAGRAKVIALEPVLAPTLHAARAAGKPVDVEVSGLAADSLGARRIGEIAWQIAHAPVDGARTAADSAPAAVEGAQAAAPSPWVADSLLLSEDAIREAQLWLWKEMKIAVEPAAALPLAALRSGAYRPAKDEKVCLIVCGANLDIATLSA